MVGETVRGGGPGGTFPSGPHKFHFLGGTGGTQYITKMDPVYLSWAVFSNCNSCIGGFGPFETLVDPFPRGPQRPSPPTSGIISPALGMREIGHIYFPYYWSRTNGLSLAREAISTNGRAVGYVKSSDFRHRFCKESGRHVTFDFEHPGFQNVVTH